jgi:heme A synthase
MAGFGVSEAEASVTLFVVVVIIIITIFHDQLCDISSHLYHSTYIYICIYIYIYIYIYSGTSVHERLSSRKNFPKKNRLG